MCKTKEYSSDVHFEHYKIESGCKKMAKELKNPILTTRAIINQLIHLSGRGCVSILS